MEIWHGLLTELNTQLAGWRVDALVCSASFEDRCLSVPVAIGAANVSEAIVGINLTYREFITPKWTQFERLLGSKLRELPQRADNPILSADSIARSIGRVLTAGGKHLLVDTTTFTRETLLMLLAFLRSNLRPEDEVKFVYAHARDYSVGDPKESKWLSKGVRDVRSVLAFPGEFAPSQKTHLIVMVGFEDERAVELIRECEPSYISLGVGDEREEGTGPHQATNLHRFKRLRSIFDSVDEFTFQAYNPDSTKDALLRQADKYPHCNVLIAPMNTKMSTIGAALCAFANPAVQLCYAPANVYNVNNYSLPDEDCYLFEIPGLRK
jgi:hypothetical protein